MAKFNIMESVDDFESLAMDFRAQLSDRGLIRTRRIGLATYPHCFVGSDAVELLQELLEEETEHEKKVGREEALLVGQKIAENFQLFESAFVLRSMDHELSDDTKFFKIKHNLPADVANTTNGMMLADYVKAMKRCVSVQDRMYRLKKYRSCFVGSEAVDTMMEQRMCVSREDAKNLIKKLNKRYACFKHVCDKNRHFEDGYYFYRFKWDQEALDRDEGQGTKVDAISCAVETLTGNEKFSTELKLTSEQSFYHQ